MSYGAAYCSVAWFNVQAEGSSCNRESTSAFRPNTLPRSFLEDSRLGLRIDMTSHWDLVPDLLGVVMEYADLSRSLPNYVDALPRLGNGTRRVAALGRLVGKAGDSDTLRALERCWSKTTDGRRCLTILQRAALCAAAFRGQLEFVVALLPVSGLDDCRWALAEAGAQNHAACVAAICSKLWTFGNGVRELGLKRALDEACRAGAVDAIRELVIHQGCSVTCCLGSDASLPSGVRSLLVDCQQLRVAHVRREEEEKRQLRLAAAAAAPPATATAPFSRTLLQFGAADLYLLGTPTVSYFYTTYAKPHVVSFGPSGGSPAARRNSKASAAAGPARHSKFPSRWRGACKRKR